MIPHAAKILIFLAVFGLGAIGGIWAQAFLMPFLASSGTFSGMPFVKEWSERTTIIKEVDEVFINRDEAVESAVGRIQNVVVGVQSTGASGVINGSGFVVTSDGLILTRASVVPQGYEVFVYMKENGEPMAGLVLKRDVVQDLAIVKIDKDNLQTAGFAGEETIRPGASVVMVANVVEDGELISIANEGTIRTVGEGVIRTNIFDKTTLKGAPLINLEGNIIGVITTLEDRRVVATPSSILRNFAGL